MRRSYITHTSPLQVISLGALFGVVLIVAISYFALQKPWLGFEVEYNPGSSELVIARVENEGPADGLLQAGESIQAIKSDSRIIDILPLHNIEEPAILPTFAQHSLFLDAQQALWDVISQPTIIIVLADREVTLTPGQDRSLSSLSPIRYWLVILFGAVAYLIGLYIWAFRRDEKATTILFIASVGFFIGSAFNAVTLSRELVFSSQFYFIISSISHLGIILFAFSIVALMWNYPRRLSSFPTTRLIYLACLLIGVNQTMEWLELPFHSYYFHFLVDFILLLTFSVRQWYSSQSSVIDRAALQWLLLSLLLSLGLTVMLFYVPTLFSTQPLIPVSGAYFVALLMFIGLALGIQRFKLFNLSNWWFETWIWIIILASLLLFDVALIYFLQISSNKAFGFSVILIALTYLPIRLWLQNYLFRGQQKNVEFYVPYLIESVIKHDSVDGFMDSWQQLLKHVFSPSEIIEHQQQLQHSQLVKNGMCLQVPNIDISSSFMLHFKNNGRKLFTKQDASLSDSLLKLAIQSLTLKQAHKEAADQERRRISRDLHDDVASQILTLIHQAKDDALAAKAKQVLKSIRTTIYSLDAAASEDIEEVLSDIYTDINERLSLADLQLNWDVQLQDKELWFNPRQHINLQRSFQEAISNIIKHANATKVDIVIQVEDSMFSFKICDDGHGMDPSGWIEGKGLNNIHTRIEEIGGEVTWQTVNGPAGQQCCLMGSFKV